MSLMERLERQKKTTTPAAPAASAPGGRGERYSAPAPAAEEYTELKQLVHTEVIDLINRESGGPGEDDPGRKAYIRSVIESVINLRGGDIPRSDRNRLITELYNDIVGLGPLEALLADPEISEIMVNGPSHVYVESHGKIRLTNVKFRDDTHVMNVINRIVASVGRRIDESSPMVDARLADGSRVNAIMLDLLSVSVAAGLGFERAMLHIINSMDGPLIDEFTVTYREMSMGRSRKDALTLLGERCGVEDLTAVTGALVQAGQLGIPIRNVLQTQSAAIRRTRRAKVQEKAAKVSTKILLPMIVFIFPVLILVLLGPSLISIVEQFS